MSKRTSIVNALTEKFKDINGQTPYNINIFNNAYPILKFWDEVTDFPSIYTTPSRETREYHPAGFAWCFLNVSIKVYCKGDTAQAQLEDLLEDIELCIRNNENLVYDDPHTTTEILIQSIVTDEGLLAPYAVGEITARIRYQRI